MKLTTSAAVALLIVAACSDATTSDEDATDNTGADDNTTEATESPTPDETGETDEATEGEPSEPEEPVYEPRTLTPDIDDVEIPDYSDGPMDWDVAPGPDGTIPALPWYFGEPAYRSAEQVGDEEPFQWDATLHEVVCGVDPGALNEEYRDNLTDSYIGRANQELCKVTIQYDHIGSTPGVPELPTGIVIDDTEYEQPSDPALDIINDQLFDEAFAEELRTGDSVIAVTYLEKPIDEELQAIYLGPDATQVRMWLLLEPYEAP